MNRPGVLLITALAFFSGFSIAWADVIEPNTHYVSKCVKINNIEDFPEIALIACTLSPGDRSIRKLELIKQNVCLDKGYKFNGFEIYWASKKYIDSVGLDNIKIQKKPIADCASALPEDCYTEELIDPELHLLSEEINPADYYVPNWKPIFSETIIYSLIRTDDGGYALKKQ